MSLHESNVTANITEMKNTVTSKQTNDRSPNASPQPVVVGSTLRGIQISPMRDCRFETGTGELVTEESKALSGEQDFKVSELGENDVMTQ